MRAINSEVLIEADNGYANAGSIGMVIGDGDTNQFNGKMDDFAVFSTVLSDSEIQQLYNNGNSLDIIP